MFGDPDAIIQIDMSEYMEKFTSSRLIGSPPGYVGHEEGGQLSEAVRRRPYAVVLFDEIEKAHPDVMHLLLQIVEEGTVTDSLGRKIDFRNTIIIMTSNVGAELIRKQTTLGFGAPKFDESHDTMKDKILEETKRVFKPEFINRLDDIIVFKTLSREMLSRIVDLEVAKVTARIREKEITLTLDEAAHEFLIEKGYDPAYGARPMRRAVERYLEDPMAEEILRGSFRARRAAQVTCEGEKLSFKVPEIIVPAKTEGEELGVGRFSQRAKDDECIASFRSTPGASVGASGCGVLRPGPPPCRTDQTIGQAEPRRICSSGLEERIFYFYVVDGEGRLSGVVPARKLLTEGLDRNTGR